MHKAIITIPAILYDVTGDNCQDSLLLSPKYLYRISDSGKKKSDEANDVYCINRAENGIASPVKRKYSFNSVKIRTIVSPRQKKNIVNTNAIPSINSCFIHFFSDYFRKEFLRSSISGVKITLVASVPIAPNRKSASPFFLHAE